VTASTGSSESEQGRSLAADGVAVGICHQYDPHTTIGLFAAVVAVAEQ